jgi:hypothetical protein
LNSTDVFEDLAGVDFLDQLSVDPSTENGGEDSVEDDIGDVELERESEVSSTYSIHV